MKNLIIALMALSIASVAASPKEVQSPPILKFVDTTTNVVCYYAQSEMNFDAFNSYAAKGYSFNIGKTTAISCVALPPKEQPNESKKKK